MKKRILFICANETDYRELKLLKQDKYEIIFHPYDQQYIWNLCYNSESKLNYENFFQDLKNDELVNSCDGILSVEDYPGTLILSMLCYELGLPGPNPKSVLSGQHKYYCRLIQKSAIETAAVEVEIFHPKKLDQISFNFPRFVKPVKSVFSANSLAVYNLDDLKNKLPHLVIKENLYQIFDIALKKYTDFQYDSSYLIAEQLLDGEQCTLEGYVFNQEVEIIGITDSIMYDGTICFKRFEYPSKLPHEVQLKMYDYAKKLISALNLDNTMFNIEFMYNEKENYIKIIEINPRMASQFADLYEKVDGVNGYEFALAIAAGQRPEVTRRSSEYKVGASCVFRNFKDQKVLQVPNEKEIEEVQNLCEAARIEIYATAGKNLSYHEQDGKSFRYGVVNIGAQSWQELYKKEELCKKILQFKFADI
ncbi:ATP-grasp domain-containing protein [Candidatus Dependentiae bacterium]|nr:ATP-grasp domain-containing protein [Candidatus Dependentiae bacterium]